RAIHNLSKVDQLHESWAVAWRHLVELHVQRGQLASAVEKLDELVAAAGNEPALPLVAVKAELLEKLGHLEQAIEAWEVIEARDPSFRDSAARVVELRAKLAPSERQPAPAPPAAPAAGAPGAAAQGRRA